MSKFRFDPWKKRGPFARKSEKTLWILTPQLPTRKPLIGLGVGPWNWSTPTRTLEENCSQFALGSRGRESPVLGCTPAASGLRHHLEQLAVVALHLGHYP
jgi:hypothetical protein